MPENEEGVNSENQDQTIGNQGSQDAAGSGGEQGVPISALQSERSKRQEAERRTQELEQRLTRMEQSSGQQQPQQSSSDPLEGLEDDEPLTAGQVRKVREQDQVQSQAVLTEIQMRQQFSDYDEIIQKHLPEKLKENPQLRFNPQDPNDIVKAYEIGKEYKNRMAGASGSDQDQGGTQSEIEQALETNSNKPGSGSQAASSSKAPPGEGERMDHAARQSPADFDQLIEEAKRSPRAG